MSKTIEQITATHTDFNDDDVFPGREVGVEDYKFTWATLRAKLSQYPSRVIPGTLTLSYSNTTTFGIAEGKILDSTFAYGLNLSSAFTKTTAAWAVGTGNGSLDTGSVGNSTTYHVFVILKDSDNSVDVLISTSSTAPTMPAGYTYKRRIGCFRTNGSAQIINFYQIGNMFRFDAQQDDQALGNIANTTRNLITVSAPEAMIGIFQFTLRYTGADAAVYAILQATDETDSAASVTNHTSYLYVQNNAVTNEMYIEIDSSRQIAYRGSTTLVVRIGTVGWIDPLL